MTTNNCAMSADIEDIEDMNDELEPLLDLDALERACAVRRVLEVQVKALGRVYVRMVTAGEFDQISRWSRESQQKKGDADFRYRVVSLLLSDENGERIVPDGAIERVKRLDNDVIQTIFDKGIEFITPTDEDVEEAEKN